MAASVVDHPLVHHHLTRLRSVDTGYAEFRQRVRHLSTLLAFEATSGLKTRDQRVTTPLCETTGKTIDQSISLVPILRAGLGMLDPVLQLIPEAEVRHLGLYRDESTAMPVEYYNKLPDNGATDVAIVLDPMLATGGSAALVCQTLLDWGVSEIIMLSLLAAPEGIEALEKKVPSVRIVVCAIDEKLDHRKFIVPGLGDAGDRIFSTET